jgi:predicted metal-binding membrane protein
VPTAIFVLGYLAVWSGFSVVAALIQWGLHGAALLSPAMKSNSGWLGGVLLIFAGLFQWTPWKHSCLRHCASPLGFVLGDWREGWAGGFSMGLKHGAYCLGCCWLLMALLFVAGVMNIFWIAALSLLVLVEKLLPHARGTSGVIGAVCLGWGAWMLWP